jgi:predicted molibdopterin-dependent oxidoreductase YjgC
MLGEAGYFTSLPKPALDGMIDVVKGIEPEPVMARFLQLSEVEAAMRESRIKRTKTVCTYCGVGCSFDIWTKDRHILKVEPAQGPANGVSTCIKGKFGWDYVNSPDRLTKPLIREGEVSRSLLGRGSHWWRAGFRDQSRHRARLARLHLFVKVHQRRELPDAEAGPRGDRHQ